MLHGVEQLDQQCLSKGERFTENQISGGEWITSTLSMRYLSSGDFKRDFIISVHVCEPKFMCTLCMEEPKEGGWKRVSEPQELGSQAMVSHRMGVGNSFCILCRKVWNLHRWAIFPAPSREDFNICLHYKPLFFVYKPAPSRTVTVSFALAKVLSLLGKIFVTSFPLASCVLSTLFLNLYF